LHKLVFQENVLEDGAAVGYFVLEKVGLMIKFLTYIFFTLDFPDYVFHVFAENIAGRNKHKPIWYFVWLL
jgi:hypothetical protein